MFFNLTKINDPVIPWAHKPRCKVTRGHASELHGPQAEMLIWFCK